MYTTAYNKLLWGMMFIILNINLGQINILPNFIGYILILTAVNTLKTQHEIFEKGKIPAIILVLLTLDDIFKLGNINLLEDGFQTAEIWVMVLGAVETLLSLYLIYIICKGIYLLADERENLELKSSVKVRFSFYLIMDAIILFYTPFIINLSRNEYVHFFYMGILKIIAAVLITGMFRTAKNQLLENGGDLNV